MKRRWEIDALRGLMLVMMNLTHLPTRFAEAAGQPLGYVSAAEGFVLLSAFTVGLVYCERARRRGIPAMRRAFWLRALKLYGCQAALLMFLFTIIALLGLKIDQPAVKNLMSFYLHAPWTGLWSGLLLIYNPPLLDILPIYIVFMLASPLLLAHGLRHGWRAILVASVLLWLLAQFDLARMLYGGLVALTGLPVPFRETGSFEMYAWQFLWVLGLWLGSGAGGSASVSALPQSLPPARSPLPARFPHWIVLLALVWALICLVWRHRVGQVPFRGMPSLEPLFDKWYLGPLRLLDLFALMLLALQFGPAVAARLPRPRFLETLGAASLPVFCAHLIIVLLALALFGGVEDHRPLWLDVLIVVVSFALLWMVARIARHIDPLASAGYSRTAPPVTSEPAPVVLPAAIQPEPAATSQRPTVAALPPLAGPATEASAHVQRDDSAP